MLYNNARKIKFANVAEWQTRLFKGQVSNIVWVQVPPFAPKKIIQTNKVWGFFICFLFVLFLDIMHKFYESAKYVVFCKLRHTTYRGVFCENVDNLCGNVDNSPKIVDNLPLFGGFVPLFKIFRMCCTHKKNTLNFSFRVFFVKVFLLF